MSDEWNAVGEEIKKRRIALRKTQTEMASAADVSDTTWSQIELAKADGFGAKTIAGVCAALGWSPDSIDLIREGGRPVELYPAIAERRPNGPDEVDEIEREIGRLIGELARRARGEGR